MSERWVAMAVVIAGCGQSPAPPAANPTTPTPNVTDAESEVPAEAGAAPRIAPELEPIAIDDTLPADDAIYQLHVRTRAQSLPKTSLLRDALRGADELLLGGYWPDFAWALVFFPHWKLPDAGTARLFHWIKGRWEEVPGGKDNDVADYAFGASQRGRVVIVRGKRVGGNMQARVVPRILAVTHLGQLDPLPPEAPKDFIGRDVQFADTGEIFMSGTRPPVNEQSRPAIAVWSPDERRVRVFDLPSEHDKALGIWTSNLDVNQLCVESTTSALVVGSEQSDADPEPILTTWRWDGTSFQRARPIGHERFWSSACTPDGTLWLGIGNALVRLARDGTRSSLAAPAGSTLVTTARGDVFLKSDDHFYRLHRG